MIEPSANSKSRRSTTRAPSALAISKGMRVSEAPVSSVQPTRMVPFIRPSSSMDLPWRWIGTSQEEAADVAGELRLIVPHSVRREVQHPRTPAEVRKPALAAIYTVPTELGSKLNKACPCWLLPDRFQTFVERF